MTRESGALRVLVGKRNPKSRFLGGFFAFPGGAHEPEDGDPSTVGEDASLRRCASRELLEETGLRVAPDAWAPAGRRVTPPFGPLRFDSLMYVTELPTAEEPKPEDPGELLHLEWDRPVDLVRRWRALEIRIAPPLIPILHELARSEEASAGEIAARLAAVNDELESGGPHIEFVPDVITMLVKTPTLPPATHTNCYLVGAEDFVIIDPGSEDAVECARVLRHVRRRCETGGQPRAVVLTHHHGDHVAGALRVATELDLPVWAHPDTWDRWAPGAALRGREGSLELADGDRLDLSGGERLRVLHTPGHAVGHVALHEENRGSLFAGDLVSGASTILVDSAPGSMDIYLASLERIRDLGAHTLFPGHGFPFIRPAQGVQAVIDHRHEREAKILDALGKTPRAVVEIVGEAYADTPQANPGLAASQAEVHLDRLERRGLARREAGGWARIE